MSKPKREDPDMTKNDDTLHEEAEQVITPRLHKVKVAVSEYDHDLISRAIVLWQACYGEDVDWLEDFPASQGKALAGICRAWMNGERHALKLKAGSCDGAP